jgi:N utilization substance protein B
MPPVNPPSTNQNRSEARVLAMQGIYQLDAQGDKNIDNVEVFLSESGASDDVIKFARGLITDTWAHREKIDKWITDNSKHWDLARIAPVERSIIRMALLEMLIRDDPPVKVAINEAIELGKTFGTAESPQFINGLLDAIRKQHESQNTKER